MTSPLMIEISEENADPVRLDQLSRYLLRDLRAHGAPVERGSAKPPPGAKSGGSIALGTLVLGLLNSATIAALTSGLIGWLGNRRTGIKISCGDRSIELTSATPEQQRQLIEWLRECGGLRQDQNGERSS